MNRLLLALAALALPGTLAALGGLVVDPWKGRLPAGTPVMVVGREPTQ